VPLNLEPGACYLAVAALTHGVARGLGLRAFIGTDEIADERGFSATGSVIAFCAGEQDAGRVVVEARGTALAWGLGIYRTHGGAWAGVP
jgi:hypothetical protein